MHGFLMARGGSHIVHRYTCNIHVQRAFEVSKKKTQIHCISPVYTYIESTDSMIVWV